MKLTPIRVRGKRKRPPRVSSAVTTLTSSTSATHDATTSSTESKESSSFVTRPPSSPSASPPSKMPRTTASARAKTKAKPVPFDRRFPFEIIERIFLLSENLNLPKSSPRLGWLLSGRRTLIEMVICAFGPTWDLFTASDAGLDDAHMDDSTARFQTSILTYSWATADLLLDAEHLWVQRTKLLRAHLRSLNDVGLDLGHAAPLTCVVNPSRLSDLLNLHPPPEPAGAKQQAVSVYPCFTFDQLVFMLRCHESYYIDPSPNEEPLDLLEKGHSLPVLASALITVHEVNYCLDKATSPFIDHQRGCTYWHVHHGVRIPEWLLLGGGPYSQRPQNAAQNTRAHRDAVRQQLRLAFDTLYWVVQGGARLAHTDSWEVTLQGVRHLLAVDLTPHEDEEDAFAATAARALVDKRTKDWGAGGVRADMVYLGYSLDSLVMGYLALLGSLGLFTRSWPAKVMEDFMLAVTERAVDDPGFRTTRTFRYLQRAALHRWSLGQIHAMMARDPLSMTALGDARTRYREHVSSTSAGASADR